MSDYFFGYLVYFTRYPTTFSKESTTNAVPFRLAPSSKNGPPDTAEIPRAAPPTLRPEACSKLLRDWRKKAKFVGHSGVKRPLFGLFEAGLGSSPICHGLIGQEVRWWTPWRRW